MSTAKTSEKARLGRQLILDTMRDGKWITAAQIGRKIGEPVRSIAARLGVMRTAKEVESRVASKDLIEFRALVKVTQAKMPMNPSAIAAMNAVNTLAAAQGPQYTDTPTQHLPGRIIHEGSRRRNPLPSPRGQGATPLAFGIQSVMG